MRGPRSPVFRAAPIFRSLIQETYSPANKYRKQILSKTKSQRPSEQNTLCYSRAISIGSPPAPNSRLTNPSLISLPTCSSPAEEHTVSLKPIDHPHFSGILSSNDWFVLLNHEFKAKRIVLAPQFVVSVLQNQENPLSSLRYYIWVSNVDPLLAKRQSVRGSLASNLNRKGPGRPVLLSVDLLQQIKTYGLKVTADLLCILLGSWGRLGLAKYCVEIFGQISFLGLSPSTRLYNAVIDALIKSNSLDLAYLKFQQMSSDNCIPDRFTYNILIHGVCRLGVVDEALRLIKQMEDRGFVPNVFTYTILIDGFCNSNRVDEAFRILQTMKEKNVVPNAATMRSLVHGVFRCNDPEKAFEFLLEFVEKKKGVSKLVCDTILYCLSNNSMATETAAFLRKFGDKGYIPDSSTFNIAMTCLIKKLDPNKACGIFDYYVRRGVKPGFNTYLALIEALYRAKKLEQGNQYMDQVKDGLVSNIHSYNMVIDCLCKAKIMDKASETFRDLQYKCISPNVVTFNTLICGYCKNRDMVEAQKLLELLLEHGLMPDIFTFNSIIDGLCQVHKYDDAFACFTEMVEWDVTPNEITYNTLMHSLCAIGDVGRSTQLLKKMKVHGFQPDTFSFNGLIQSFLRTNKFQKAKKLLGFMWRWGITPDNHTYGAFTKSLCKSGRLDEAKEMFFSMEVNGCTPDTYTRDLICDTLARLGRQNEAQDIQKRYDKGNIL